jgi:flagellar basal-body rod protein FlgF
MIKGIFNTMGGKYITERRMDMISNNIANSLTPGYKSSKPHCQTIIKEEIEGAEPTHMSNLGTYIDFSDAPLVSSGASLDFAIEGEGFFVVSTKEGNAYTRNGQFTLNKDKKLVTMDGSLVMGQNGEITINGKDIAVENDGSIVVDKVRVDALKVVDFRNKGALSQHGKSLFISASENPTSVPPEKYSIKQGAFEGSNVDVIKELVEMISALRAYESYTKVDQFFGDMTSKLLETGKG